MKFSSQKLNIIQYSSMANLCQKTGAKLKFIPLKQDGTLDMDDLDHLILTKQTNRHQSSFNALGVINPIESI